jgi:hypothetical protein
MNKHERSTNPQTKNKKILSWKSSRALVSKSIPLELDLENREILVNDESLEIHQLEIGPRNIDKFITDFVDPNESQTVIHLLDQAGKGVEKPILFSFVHPRLSKVFLFEYRYQITYVSYAKTRLKGELVNIRKRSRNKDLSD